MAGVHFQYRSCQRIMSKGVTRTVWPIGTRGVERMREIDDRHFACEEPFKTFAGVGGRATRKHDRHHRRSNYRGHRHIPGG